MATTQTQPKLPSGRHGSQIKRQRQNIKRAEHNRGIRTEFRTLIKKLRKAIEEKDIQAAQSALKDTTSKLYKAARKNVIHPNQAARRVSRLAKAVAGIVAK